MVRVLGIALAFAVADSPSRPVAASAQVVDLAGAKKDATVAGKAWLALVDGEQYAESWSQASSLFRDKVGRERWVSMVKSVRSGLGMLQQRTFELATYLDSNGPAMVVLVWKSSYGTMPAATEQVTMMPDGGAWRCAVYFVRPR